MADQVAGNDNPVSTDQPRRAAHDKRSLRVALGEWLLRCRRVALWVAAWGAMWVLGFGCGVATIVVTLNNHGSYLSTVLAEYAVRVKGFDPDPTAVRIHMTAEALDAVNFEDLDKRKLVEGKNGKK